ncbi:hypothetical protein COCON_G00135750 [Conger conger]|uniref:E3 ubiquitin-protein ligase RNF138 n=1 Tax=Conger conger TaxID=82655 RepID=A0A9Q1HVX3_CONCO|nr:E3 ubiquitin-protein ligase RNF138-like [Conger conger]XP_061111771.1 E3 ubiquitin-protein ligase RNF138-like [Conger conger]XP_061111772.1 E3 ubiquitin-protein ligase RNF138-like [Conger conger]XP_061111773.1 E3 ubiquitin-protein ligase RNF138-like [Conger conger]XP_061111774.1 E3 ubiquitin-protein ligase RNF138-like [Conger conger]XP_061111775.1 E3 ubiquitin-protein ligase RNF138-like [Conger conger]KAJ8268403.1 hypothetical protein COCON_G00135750 [Conger conger]
MKMESTGPTVNRINTEGALEDSSDVFDCPICHDVFKTPIRTRTCQHVFCQSCFRTAVRTQGPHCPLCRGPVSEREKRAEDIVQRMRETRGPCRACGSSTLYSKMRTHYKYCPAYIDEYGLPAASRNVQRAQNGSANGPQPIPPIGNSPALHVRHLSSSTGSSVSNRATATYSCPYCQQQGLSDMALVQHCATSHTGDLTPVVCPICVATSWGDPNYCSQNFIGHLMARHRYSYDIYMNVHDDEDTQLHLAIQHSILQMSERIISA